MEELTPHIEELKRVIGEDVDEEQLIDELNTYLNVYHVSVDAAKKGIMRKYGKDTPLFVSAASIAKKLSEMTGDEKNVDLTARVVFIEEKQITARGVPKTIFSGILGDETATAPFTVWDVGKFELTKGETYNFKNAYTKKWNDKLQINFGERSIAEVSERKIQLPERNISYSSDTKISELTDGKGDVTVTGKIISVEPKTINSRGEVRTVFTGYIADDTGKVQFTAWNDVDLKADETICAKNAYVRAWRGVPQLNFGDQCEISRVDAVFAEVHSGLSKRSIGDILRTGGGLDVMVSGSVVDVRTGSGLIRRCPECNRSILGDECATHGKVEVLQDLRMKVVIDDGTGALTAVVNREWTEKLIGMTLEKAIQLSKQTGDQDSVLRAMDERVLVMNVTASGNVLSDDFGPMMIAREIVETATDVIGEAEGLMNKVEGSL
ncbi:MAG: single-stranded DNA-binding protein [Methanomassiliicoccaceae archaeon]|jgi:replication factor A1|nr:single-stranded DNA-binding protein [Methanomassiliicoccaceae archaeon]